MRLTTIKTDASVGTLADRVYANLTPDSRKLAEAALLKANPHLARAGAFQPGVVVNLPELAGLKLKPAEAGHDPAGDLLDGLKEAVAGYRKQLEKTRGAALADLKTQEDLLKLKDVAAAIKAAPGAPELAKSLAAALKERRTAIAEEAKRADAAFDAIAKDLDSMK